MPVSLSKEDSIFGSVTTGILEILEPSFSYVGNNILVNDTVSFDTHYFNKICNQVPESLCQSYIIALDDFRKRLPNRGGGGSFPYEETYEETYEEILKHYMDLAADVSVLGKVDFLVGLFEFFVKINIPGPSIQTISLSMIWASMIYDLEKKHSSSPSDCEKNRIAKMSIGLLGFVTQVFNREFPLSNWFSLVYKAFATAGDYFKESPYLYQKIFPNKIIDIKEFPNWHKELAKHIDREDKVTIGKAFNICYTFRVGDIYLHSVLNSSSYFDDKLKERLIDSLYPIPRERDIMRVFDLYTKPKIY